MSHEVPPEICVRVAGGCHQQSVATGLPNGTLRDTVAIPPHAEGFGQFFARIAQHWQRDDCAVAR